ncbi:MAG UNVERIFIED_CONTAM: hypothetical protein LVR18_48635 [Planctomycetaceae bacterium]
MTPRNTLTFVTPTSSSFTALFNPETAGDIHEATNCKPAAAAAELR